MILPVIKMVSPDLGAVEDALRGAPAHVMDAVKDELRVQAELVATEAKTRCPVDMGTLRASIHADAPTEDGQGVHVAVVAGEGLAYARYQHYREDLNHTVGEALFLDRAGEYLAPDIAAAVDQTAADAFASALRGIPSAEGV